MPKDSYTIDDLFTNSLPESFNPPTSNPTPSFQNDFLSGIDARRIFGTLNNAINLGGTVLTISNTDNIQDKIDAVALSGGGTVFLQPGTYVLPGNILVPGGVTLEGVSRDDVILDCGTYSVQITGTNPYTTGTIAVNKGATSVTGTLTVWDSTMVGRYILLDGQWYLIDVVGGAGSITIDTAFQGTVSGGNVSGQSYAIADVNFAANIRRLTIINATGSGMMVQYAQEPKLDDIILDSCGIGIDCDYVVYPQIFTTSNNSGTNLDFNYTYGFEINFSGFGQSTSGPGMVMTNSGNATVFDSIINGNFGNGITLTNVNNVAFVSMTINSNGGKGVEMVANCNDLEFISATSQANTSDGYKLTATTDRVVISSTSIVNNGGWGVNIAAASCDNNILLGVVASGNSSGTVTDSGTGTLKSTAVNVI